MSLEKQIKDIEANIDNRDRAWLNYNNTGRKPNGFEHLNGDHIAMIFEQHEKEDLANIESLRLKMDFPEEFASYEGITWGNARWVL